MTLTEIRLSAKALGAEIAALGSADQADVLDALVCAMDDGSQLPALLFKAISDFNNEEAERQEQNKYHGL